MLRRQTDESAGTRGRAYSIRMNEWRLPVFREIDDRQSDEPDLLVVNNHSAARLGFVWEKGDDE